MVHGITNEVRAGRCVKSHSSCFNSGPVGSTLADVVALAWAPSESELPSESQCSFHLACVQVGDAVLGKAFGKAGKRSGWG